MKKTILLCLLLLPLLLHAQLSPEQMGGVYYAYPAPDVVAPAQAPPGYRLVYVSHYGRHGSRWLTSDTRYEWVLAHFDDANLTRSGRKAKRLLQKVYDDARGNGGRLTPVGARQHGGIAARMTRRFPGLFSPHTDVRACSSVVGRCRKSMEAFTGALRAVYPDMYVATRADSADMRWMSYDSPDERLLQRETRAPLGVSARRFVASLFKDTTKVADGGRLLSEMFTIASDMQDVDGVRADLYQFFTPEEMQACYRQSCRKMWHQNGLDPSNHGIPAQCAARLWGNIAACADSALASGRPAATLRFGHDTALYRLLSLLGSATVADGGGENLCDIVPMAANLQMAFYRNDADSVLVAFWLNERPMSLAGFMAVQSVSLRESDGSHTGDSVAFYSWAELKARLGHYLVTQKWKDRTAAVNTMVGTAYAVTRSVGLYGKGSEEHGQTLPAVLAPHGMNFWTPQTRATERKCVAPYYYPDSLLQGFRASHWIVGGCTQDYGSFTIMPMTGRLRLKPAERATRFSHSGEVSHPYYYAVSLPDERLVAEMTASAGPVSGISLDGGSRAAIFRFTPEADGVMHVVVNPNSDYGEGFVAVDTATNSIYGYNPVHRIYQGWGERAGFSGWFVVQFQRPITVSGVTDTVAYVSLDVRRGEPVLVRAATSFTGLDGAWANLRAEMPTWDFLGTRLRLDSVWRQQLATIDVDDADAAKVGEFYGALYRASFLPRVMSDADGSHPAFSKGTTVTGGRRREAGDSQMLQDNRQASVSLQSPVSSLQESNHKAQSSKLKAQSDKAQSYYGDYSMWDIYRAQLPLLTIIEPERMGDMMQSLVTKYEEGGWMPIFPCWNSYTAAMIGDHAAAALADAWVKGIRGFDVRKAYEGVRRNAFDSPATVAEYKDGMGRRALKSYLRYGYIPMEDSVMEAFHTHEQVSRTLEYAYDDFCAAQLAKAVGREADYRELMRRSANWRNVINPRTGWADGRYAPQSSMGVRGWLGNTDLTRRVPFITEGAVMHYSFYVPHDIGGLMEAMGGRDRFIARLDTLFGLSGTGDAPNHELRTGNYKPKASNSFYWHGNEPCHHIAYLYALAGQPRKTQRIVRDILRLEYMDVPGGLSGNDDAGQMSAWYIFSSLGFYPVCPGKAEYVVGVPSFRRARIGNLTIEADGLSPANRYITAAYWNGTHYTSPVITHDMIVRGGTLRFVMGATP